MKIVFYGEWTYKVYDNKEEAAEITSERLNWIDLLPSGFKPQTVDQLQFVDPIGKYINFPDGRVVPCLGLHQSAVGRIRHVALETPLGWFKIEKWPRPISIRKLLTADNSIKSRDYNFMAMFLLTGNLNSAFARAYAGELHYNAEDNLKKKPWRDSSTSCMAMTSSCL